MSTDDSSSNHEQEATNPFINIGPEEAPTNIILEEYAKKHNMTYDQAVEELLLQREQMLREYKLKRMQLCYTKYGFSDRVVC